MYPHSGLRFCFSDPAITSDLKGCVSVEDSTGAPDPRGAPTKVGNAWSTSSAGNAYTGHWQRYRFGCSLAADAYSVCHDGWLSVLPGLALVEADAHHARIHGVGTAQSPIAPVESLSLFQITTRAVGCDV